jgi:hypothetical protein
MKSDKISNKLDELFLALQYGSMILDKAFGEYAHFSKILHPIFPTDEYIDASYTKIRTREFKLEDGIYPILEIIQDIDLRKVDIYILTEPQNKTRVIRIWDDRTDRSFLKGWQKLVSISSKAVPFLVVERGNMRIEVLEAVECEYCIDFGVVLNWNEVMIDPDFVARVYFLSKMVVELIEDVLWRNDLLVALKKFADNLLNNEMMIAKHIYENVAKNFNGIEFSKDKRIEKWVDEIHKNPNKYPLPISLDMSWMRFKDLLYGKHNLPSDFFLITQWYFSVDAIKKLNLNKKYDPFYLVINNSIAIYRVPQAIIYDYTEHWIKEYLANKDWVWVVEDPKTGENKSVSVWPLYLVFVWPNKTITISEVLILLNPYLTKENDIMYIPNELAETILKAIKELSTNEIGWKAKQSLDDSKNLLNRIIENIKHTITLKKLEAKQNLKKFGEMERKGETDILDLLADFFSTHQEALIQLKKFVENNQIQKELEAFLDIIKKKSQKKRDER